MVFNTPNPFEKLARFLEPDPEEVATMPIEDVREELSALGIDTGPLKKKLKHLVRKAMEQEEHKQSIFTH